MSRNDAQDFAQRLYSRLPGHYRVYDAQQGQPLLALLRVVGMQVANVRQDMDALWDNFFIETCDDWVVPYLGALVGTNLLQQPLDTSNRLDVWNTVLWRRRKGTPQMLEALAQSISGWHPGISEFFLSLGWSQNVDHVRLNRPLSPDLRDPSQLSQLGRAGDPFAHAADFRPALALEQARTRTGRLGSSVLGWGTLGRYQVKNLGVFVGRLQTFPVKGVTPAAAAPGLAAPPSATCFNFNPLFRDTPLFNQHSAVAVTRAEFAGDPWKSFGSDISVRQFGVLLATEAAPSSSEVAGSEISFTFGNSASIKLDTNDGLRLMDPRSLQLGSAHFLIGASWQPSGAGLPTSLGVLSTFYSFAAGAPAFAPGSTASGPGQLVITVRTARPGAGWSGGPLPASPAARFPGAILAVRLSRTGPLHAKDGLYVYLPPSFLSTRDLLTYFVADDGSTFTSPSLDPVTLARLAEGQVYPPRALNPTTTPADAFTVLQRTQSGLRLLDSGRFGGGAFLFEAGLLTAPSALQVLGAVATTDQVGSSFPDLQAPSAWPAFTYAPSKNAVTGDVPASGLLSIRLLPLAAAPQLIPPAELVVVNRAGESLLVYLPEVPNAPASGAEFLVADDGSTYFLPADPVAQQAAIERESLSGLVLARAAQGQVIPIPGLWPLRQRSPVAINLCRSERSSMLAQGELGIDPELGKFALPPQDPSLKDGNFSVDFVEALGFSVGALNFDRQLALGPRATRLVSQSGDADSLLTAALAGAPVHSNLADAIAAANEGDVIEIVDSATYSAVAAVTVPASLKTLTIRAAAGERPCLAFYVSSGQPTSDSLLVPAHMDSLSLNGLLISGGPMRIQSNIKQVNLFACTLDPDTAAQASLIASESDAAGDATYVLSHCVTGGLQAGEGVSQLTLADSMVDQRGAPAISGVLAPGSPPQAMPSARGVQLERVTVLGSIFCDVLNASECLLDDIAIVQDRQSGCVRFTRFEQGSLLPRRYQCIPSEAQAEACSGHSRCMAPIFNSRSFSRPEYAQLASGCPQPILTASESRAEIGAFAGAQNTIRLRALQTKLQEFIPVGLRAVIIAES